MELTLHLKVHFLCQRYTLVHFTRYTKIHFRYTKGHQILCTPMYTKVHFLCQTRPLKRRVMSYFTRCFTLGQPSLKNYKKKNYTKAKSSWLVSLPFPSLLLPFPSLPSLPSPSLPSPSKLPYVFREA